MVDVITRRQHTGKRPHEDKEEKAEARKLVAEQFEKILLED